MNDFDQFVPEHIRALSAYSPGKPIRRAERESGVACIKMASNENPFGPSPKALEAMSAAAGEANFYPDNDCSELRSRLAGHYGLEEPQVLITAGSTQLLDIIAHTLLAPGLNAVTSERSFIVYPIVTQSAGARMINAPMRGDTYDLEAVARAINPETRVVFLSNPNNPTGTMFDAAATDAFLRRIPGHVLVVLDEAYCDFAEEYARPRGIEYTHSLDYVREQRNVIVLRTFSKAHGLAGLRVGYGLGPPRLLQHLARVRTAFSISAVAEAAAIAAMDDSAHIRKTIENNTAGARFLSEQLAAMGLRSVPTCANFIYFDAGEDSVQLAKRMQAAGIIVRPMSAWGAPTAVRVSIGTPEQNRRFLDALSKVLERAAVR